PADGTVNIFDGRIGLNNFDELPEPLARNRKCLIWSGLEKALYLSIVLLREETLRHDDIQIDTQAGRPDRHHQHQCRVLQDPAQGPPVTTEHAVEARVKSPVKNAVLPLIVRAQKLRAHGWRGRE